MIPERHKVKPTVMSEPKEEHCFYLNSGNDHTSDCSKIMLSPSGIASYSTDVTWGYRRAPFMGEWTTPRGGTAMAGPPSLPWGGLSVPQASNRKCRRASRCGTSHRHH